MPFAPTSSKRFTATKSRIRIAGLRTDPTSDFAVDRYPSGIFGAQRGELGNDRPLAVRIEALLGSGTVVPGVAGTAGSSCAAIHQSTRCCCVLNPMTPKVLIDPAALDPTGLTTLDAWQPDKQGRHNSRTSCRWGH